MSKKRGSVLIFTILFINTFCIISMSTLTMVVKKNNYLYENEQRLNDSILEKRLETCKGIIKSNMNLVKENIENECTVLIGRIDKDRIYVENKLIKIYMHKSGTYYYVYEFQYVKEDGLKYIRDEVKDCGKLL